MNTTFIYVLKDPETGIIRYVGKSNDPTHRLLRHKHDSVYRRNHRARWVASLAKRGLKPQLEIIDEVLVEEWPAWEAAYIQFFRESGCDLTNATDGGDCGPDNTGKKSSPETCQKIRLSKVGSKNPNFGKKIAPEICARMGESRKGRKDSIEVRATKSAAIKFWWDEKSPEDREKMRLAAVFANGRRKKNR